MAASTETTAGEAPATSPVERVREAFNRLGNQQKIALMVAVAAIVAIVIGGVMWSRQPDWRVLFSNLPEKDGGAIIAVLEQQNIPHKFNDRGSILVPANRVHDVRLKLAGQGLPRGGIVGFELMENQKFGISQFAEQVNYQRGLEGELARTIMSIGAVESARVHLAIPKPSVFIREDQKPSASVLLNLFPGRALDVGQISGITHLISSSVPQLANGNVTILDQDGNLLSPQQSKLMEAGLDPTQIKYVREIEEGVGKRIEEILKPLFGRDNYKVKVAADIDFSQSEQTAETYRPNADPESTAVRSRQNNETANVAQTQGGVPGALTNQPPVPATAPLTTPPTGQGATGAVKPGQAEDRGKIDAAGINAPINITGQPVGSSKNATINYELDKTVRYTKQSVGVIRRLTAAVVVNYVKGTDKAGKEITKPLPDEEMKKINDLVREAMGFNKERGDSLSIANSPFTGIEKEGSGLPIWKDPENIDLAKELLRYLVLAGIVFFLYLKMVKPALRTMFPPPPEPEDESVEGVAGAAGHVAIEGEEGEDQVVIDHYAIKVQKARDIAQADPKSVANILKEWMGANG